MRVITVTLAMMIALAAPAQVNEQDEALEEYVQGEWDKALHLLCAAMYVAVADGVSTEEDPDSVDFLNRLNAQAEAHRTLARSLGADAEELATTILLVTMLGVSNAFSMDGVAAFLGGQCAPDRALRSIEKMKTNTIKQFDYHIPKAKSGALPFPAFIRIILRRWLRLDDGTPVISPELMSDGEIDQYIQDCKDDLDRVGRLAKQALQKAQKTGT